MENIKYSKEDIENMEKVYENMNDIYEEKLNMFSEQMGPIIRRERLIEELIDHDEIDRAKDLSQDEEALKLYNEMKVFESLIRNQLSDIDSHITDAGYYTAKYVSIKGIRDEITGKLNRLIHLEDKIEEAINIAIKLGNNS